MDPRFWLDTAPLVEPFGDSSWGIVDEEAGGVIAYFGSFALAVQYVKLRKNDDES